MTKPIKPCQACSEYTEYLIREINKIIREQNTDTTKVSSKISSYDLKEYMRYSLGHELTNDEIDVAMSRFSLNGWIVNKLPCSMVNNECMMSENDWEFMPEVIK